MYSRIFNFIIIHNIYYIIIISIARNRPVFTIDAANRLVHNSLGPYNYAIEDLRNEKSKLKANKANRDREKQNELQFRRDH